MKRARSLVLEGLTIVVSILLAFTIDAWWDSAQEHSKIERDLVALRVDVETNRQRLKWAADRGDRSMAGAQALILAIGPNTPLITPDSLRMLLGAAFIHGAQQLELASANALLGSAAFAGSSSADLFRALTDFRAEYDHFRSDGDLFIRLREDVISYLITVSPGAFVSAGLGIHAETDFPVDVESLLRDQRLEGLVGNMAVRINSLNENVADLAAVVDTLSALVGPAPGS